jgi:hypothetical protein
MTVVSRLRKDAALDTVSGPRAPGRRGRPRVYGESRIELAKQAGQRRGWTTGSFVLYGERVRKRYKTFEATWKPAGGLIRVVPVAEPTCWVAFFCTDVTASVEEILAAVADRFALETAFRDLKEVVGAGQHRGRNSGGRRAATQLGRMTVKRIAETAGRPVRLWPFRGSLAIGGFPPVSWRADQGSDSIGSI